MDEKIYNKSNATFFRNTKNVCNKYKKYKVYTKKL